MRLLLVFLLLLGAFALPQWWTRRVFSRYGAAREDFARTGSQLARHLLDRLGLEMVEVEVTEIGDHYDPESKTVRLSPDHFRSRSLTAVTVAAHEVGHALQDHTGYAPLATRTELVRFARRAERVGGILMLGIPVLAALMRSPRAGLMVFVVGVLTMGLSSVVHLMTLPVEWDASFRRALPVLEKGGFLADDDLLAARQILRAAAFTYVAASLASLLNLWRWLAVFRRA